MEIVERLSRRGHARAGIVGGRLGLNRGVVRHFEVALGERAALDEALDSSLLPFRPLSGLLRRSQLRLRRRQRVLQHTSFDARDEPAGAHGLALFGDDLQHRPADLGTNGRLALGLELARDERADADVTGRHGDDVLAADFDGRGGGCGWGLGGRRLPARCREGGSASDEREDRE